MLQARYRHELGGHKSAGLKSAIVRAASGLSSGPPFLKVAMCLMSFGAAVGCVLALRSSQNPKLQRLHGLSPSAIAAGSLALGAVAIAGQAPRHPRGSVRLMLTAAPPSSWAMIRYSR